MRLFAEWPPGVLHSSRTARWIAVPDAPPAGYGVLTTSDASFDLNSDPPPSSYTSRATTATSSSSTRARGVGACARRPHALRYETVDLARRLKVWQERFVAAVVWNFGPHEAAEAQISARTGFLLQGDTDEPSATRYESPPEVRARRGLRPAPRRGRGRERLLRRRPRAKRVAGAAYPWGWERADFDDSGWRPPRRRARTPREVWDNRIEQQLGAGLGHLAARAPQHPAVEETPLRLARVRSEHGLTVPESFPARPHTLQGAGPHEGAAVS